MTKIMTTSEAADVMGLHESTIRRMCEDGRLKAQWCDTLWAIDAHDVYRKGRRQTWDEAVEHVTKEHESLWRKLGEM